MTDLASSLLHGRYEVVEVVGAGGQGTLVRAVDRRHDRPVALKVRRLPPAAEAADRLLLEARTLLSLVPHPSLPVVRDDFFEGDRHVLVLDWIDGIDLDRVLRDQGNPGLPVSTVLRWMADASAALSHLHASDPVIVHGDVKPANLLLTREGRIVVVDFGVSSTRGRHVRGGTIGFRAPEIASGAHPSRAADVYGLAATAFALLTGAPPSGILPRWDGVEEAHAAQLERALRRGLATDPARRTSSTGELVEELRAGWDGEPLPTGVLTFLATYIAASTRLWQDRRGEMPGLLAGHLLVIDRAVQRHGGRRLGDAVEADATLSVFNRAGNAVAAAVDIQRDLAGGPLNVRCGVHTGAARHHGGSYQGETLSLTTRIRDLAEGGQVLVSSTTARLVAIDLPTAVGLVDLGSHRLAGVDDPQPLVAVDAPGLAVPPDPSVAPYPGLAAFGEDDRDLFFGRTELAIALAGRVRPGGVVAVVGASGSGKSSLVRAGVVPRLSGAVVITPGVHPLSALPADTSNPIVVDQLEEIFTRCTDPAERSAFVDRLLGHAHGIVVTVRGDLYAQLAELPSLAAAAAEDHVLLSPLTANEMADAIEGPARARGFTLESGLVDVVLADARTEPGALPLVAHALRETWLRREGRTLTVAGYRAAGGVRGALIQTAELLYDGLDPSRRALLRNVLLRMVEPGEGVADARRRVDRAELEALWGADEIDPLLERLATARLVTLDGSSVEPAHEALLRAWPRLHGWIDDAREQLRLQRNLAFAAAEWRRSGRDPAELARGARLAAAQELVTQGLALSPDELAFVEASLEHERRSLEEAQRSRRRQRRLRVGAVVAVVLALLAATAYFVQARRANNDRRNRETAELVSRAQAASQADVNLAMLLASQAASRADTSSTAGAVLSALARRPHLDALLGRSTSTIEALAIHGELVAFGSLDEVRMWDLNSRSERGRLPVEGVPFGITISPDGATLVVTTPDTRQLTSWDIASGAQVASWESPPSPRVIEVAFTPSGTALVALHLDLEDPAATGFLQLHDPTTLAPFGQRLAVPVGRLDDLDVAPDGTLVVDTTADPQAESRDDRPEVAGAVWLIPMDGTEIGEPTVLAGSAGVAPTAVATGPDVVAAGLPTGGIQVWERRPEGWARALRLNLGEEVYRVAVSPDGRYIAAASNNGTVAAWDRSTGTPLLAPAHIHAGRASELEFSPDGQWLVSGGYDRTVAVQAIDGRSAITSVLSGASGPTMPAWSADGSTVAVADLTDPSVRAVDPSTGAIRWSAETAGTVNGLAIAGDRLVVAETGPVIEVRHTDGGDVLTTLELGDAVDAINVVASPDGRAVAAALVVPASEGPAGRLALWDTDDWTSTLGPPTPLFVGLAISPDGRTVATGHADGRVRLWDAGTLALMAESPERPDERYSSLAFAGDGRRVVAAGLSGAIDRFSVPDLEPHETRITGHGQNVDGLAVLGSWIVSAGDDGTMRIWELESGLPVGEPFPTGGHSTVTVAAAPDGRRVATPGRDGTVLLIELDPRAWRAAACRFVNAVYTTDAQRALVGERPACSS